MEVFENVSYEAKNLISYRGKHAQEEMQSVLMRLYNHAEANGAKKNGHVITITYSVDKAAGITDTQMLIPLDKEIKADSSNYFEFIPVFSITDCLVAKHKGNPKLVQEAYVALANKAQSLGCKIKMPIYSILVNEPSPNDIESFEMHIYALVEAA